MSGRLPLIGGPLDGGDVADRFGRFVWVGEDGVGRASGPGHLYERLGDSFWFSGRRAVCLRCGAVHDRAEGGAERPPCQLCGGELVDPARLSA